MVKRDNFLVVKQYFHWLPNPGPSHQYFCKKNFIDPKLFLGNNQIFKGSPSWVNFDLPKNIPIAKNLSMSLVTDENGRIELDLKANGVPSTYVSRKSWPKIQGIAQKLLESQGTDPNDFSFQTQLGYVNMFLEGFSYTEVALQANYDTLCNLIQLDNLLTSNNTKKADHISNLIKIRLDALGVKEGEIDVALCLEKLSQNKLPWAKGLAEGPVEKQHIVDLKNKLEKDIKIKKISIKHNPPQIESNIVLLEEVSNDEPNDKNKMVLKKAQQLLKKYDESEGLEQLKDAHRKYQISLKKVEKPDSNRFEGGGRI